MCYNPFMNRKPNQPQTQTHHQPSSQQSKLSSLFSSAGEIIFHPFLKFLKTGKPKNPWASKPKHPFNLYSPSPHPPSSQTKRETGIFFWLIKWLLDFLHKKPKREPSPGFFSEFKKIRKDEFCPKCKGTGWFVVGDGMEVVCNHRDWEFFTHGDDLDAA